jgi:ComF family protein
MFNWLTHHLLPAFLPVQCLLCQRITGPYPIKGCAICQPCYLALPGKARPRCRVCAQPSYTAICNQCAVQPPVWRAAHCVCDYAGPAATLVVQFKQPDNDWIAGSLALLMLESLTQWRQHSFDLVIPVPSSSQRFLERGFNPAYQLGVPIAKQLKRPIHGNWMYKQTDSPAQHSLPRYKRLNNLNNVFVVLPEAKPKLVDQHILVIDDVMTTGATIQEMALTLQAAGVSSITALVFARTALQPSTESNTTQ